jgi:presenilin-like A22 family membrane protease
MFMILIVFTFKISDLTITIDPPELLNSFKQQWIMYFPSMILTATGIPAWLIYIKNKILVKGITKLTLVTTVFNSFVWFWLLTIGD